MWGGGGGEGGEGGGLKLCKVYINDDPGLTLTYLTERSNWVSNTFIWGKLAAKD